MQEKKPLKLLIDELLSHYGLEQRINERKLMHKWHELVGPMINKHTTDLKLKKDVLIVHLDSAALRQELSYAKDGLITELNKILGKRVIKDIVFR